MQSILNHQETEAGHLENIDAEAVRSLGIKISQPVSNQKENQVLIENLYHIAMLRPQDIEALGTIIVESFQRGEQQNYFLENTILYCKNPKARLEVVELLITLITYCGACMLRENSPSSKPLLLKISSFLLSVSNMSSQIIRMNLIVFFSLYSEIKNDNEHLEKIIERFGFTIFSQFFQNMYSQDRDYLSVQCLLDMFPIALSLNDAKQTHVAEILKYAMVDEPEQFISFLQLLLQKISVKGPRVNKRISSDIIKVHLHNLLEIACSIDHKFLVTSMLEIIEENSGVAFKNLSIDFIIEKNSYRGKLLKILRNARKKGAQSVSIYKLGLKNADKANFIASCIKRRFRKDMFSLALWQKTQREGEGFSKAV